ncbi:hypothetical protein D9M68_711630 [compost metagenome]
MSDYFAALMRASNLFADSAAPALEAPLEFGMEVPVPSVPTEPAPSTAISETRGAVAARELPAPTAPGPQPAPASLHHDDSSPATSVRRGNIPQWQQAEPGAPRSEQQAPLPGIDPQHSQPRPPQADELVRAAMRWVASDPQLAAPVLQSPVQQSPVRRAAQPDIADTGSTRLAAVQPVTIAPVDRPGLEDAPGAVRAQVQVPMPVPAPETVPPQVAAPATLRTEPEAPVAAAQEPLAISIGAIHLRVEAPAAQTVARPATPPAPAQRPTAPASPTRSGLSRRALRRL